MVFVYKNNHLSNVRHEPQCTQSLLMDVLLRNLPESICFTWPHFPHSFPNFIQFYSDIRWNRIEGWLSLCAIFIAVSPSSPFVWIAKKDNKKNDIFDWFFVLLIVANNTKCHKNVLCNQVNNSISKVFTASSWFCNGKKECVLKRQPENLSFKMDDAFKMWILYEWKFLTIHNFWAK